MPDAFGIVFCRTGAGTNRWDLRSSLNSPSSFDTPETTERSVTPIDSSGSCTLVAPHPAPRHDEERRIIGEVVHIIETTTRIGSRPLVQLLLHHEYPLLGLNEVGPRRAGIHQRPSRSQQMLRPRWIPSPCAQLSCARTTTDSPPHPAGISRRRAFPPTALAGRRGGANEMVATFTLEPFDGVGARLCPCSLATATPQAFTMASRPATSTSPRVPHPTPSSGYALQPSPDPSGSSWFFT